MWATLRDGCMGGLVGGVLRALDAMPCCGARRPAAPGSEPAPAPSTTASGADEVESVHAADAGEAGEAGDDEGPEPWAGRAPGDTSDEEATRLADSPLLRDIPLGGAGEMPPGPWRWRWVWPVPGRPSGMALVASDGTLVLWSPGGFATPGEPPDGRPTPDVATALADLPELAEAAAGMDALRNELERARAVADETRWLLNRAAGTVEDEIGRVHGQPDDDDEDPDADTR